jgi:hypothetical protein
MKLNLATTRRWIIRELADTHGIDNTMRRIISRCREVCPHPDWDELARLPYDDVHDFQDWLPRPFELSPPTTILAGLRFGLFNPIYDRGIVADIYICGSTRFDPNPDNCDWAVGPDWWPEGRYAHSKILADIYKIAYREKGLENDAEYPLCLAYGAAMVRGLLNSPDAQSFRRHCGTPGVAVGFDSGDFILLGRFTEEGIVSLEI